MMPADDKVLTIGMATYDDFDGVYFTVQSIRLHHHEVVDRIEILVIDNHPGGPFREALQHFGKLSGSRYLAAQDIRGTAVRDLIFRQARTPYVLCLDSHVLLAPGALDKLIAYLEERPDCRDLLQGPLVYDDLGLIATHFATTWSDGMYGVWSTDARGLDPDGEAFDIPMQGLGLFACRRDAWLGFNPRFSGFGGEEGYIHEKFRQAGGRTLCLPFLRWVHRFNRPSEVKYPNTWHDRLRNYLIGFDELGLDLAPVSEHFREHLGAEVADGYFDTLRRELAHPLLYFDAIYCINLESAGQRRQDMERRFERLEIDHRVRWLAAVETPQSHHVGCALSHRAILEQAWEQGLANVLVIEDDAIFLEDTLTHLEKSVAELRTRDWNLFYLGGCRWGKEFPMLPGCCHLVDPGRTLTCTQAIAYHRPIFQKILDDVPADIDGVQAWLATERGIDQYLRRIENSVLAHPVVASQPFLLDQEAPEYRHRFTLGDPEPPPEPAEELIFQRAAGVDVVTLEEGLNLRLPDGLELKLNGSGAVIVGLLDGVRSVGGIRQILRSAYPESAAEVVREVDELIDGLLSYGAIERQSGDPGD